MNRHNKRGNILATIIKNIFIFALGIIACFLFMKYIVAPGLIQQEKVYCYKLQQQSHEFPNFFITNLDKEMCDGHGIEIDEKYVVDITNQEVTE